MAGKDPQPPAGDAGGKAGPLPAGIRPSLIRCPHPYRGKAPVGSLRGNHSPKPKAQGGL